MGLSAYGKNRFAPLMKRLVWFDPRKGPRLNLAYFTHLSSAHTFETVEDGQIVLAPMWSERLVKELGPARRRGEPITERDQDLAASMQVRHEEVFLEMMAALVAQTGLRDVVIVATTFRSCTRVPQCILAHS